jgi:hypothetical protein
MIRGRHPLLSKLASQDNRAVRNHDTGGIVGGVIQVQSHWNQQLYAVAVIPSSIQCDVRTRSRINRLQLSVDI